MLKPTGIYESKHEPGRITTPLGKVSLLPDAPVTYRREGLNHNM